MNPVVLLADDHSMIRKGLTMTLKYELGYTEPPVEVKSCSELMKELNKKKPYTHLILDIQLRDGNSTEILQNIRQICPNLRIAILTMLPRPYLRKVMRDYNIDFVINKEDGEEETSRSINLFLHNDSPPDYLDDVGDNPFTTLSSREMEVLHYALKGHGVSVIASTLNVTKGTVSNHKHNILEKTGAASWRDLEKLAEAWKICG